MLVVVASQLWPQFIMLIRPLIWRLEIRIINSLPSEQRGKMFDTDLELGFYFLLLIDDLRYFLLYLVSEIPLS